MNRVLTSIACCALAILLGAFQLLAQDGGVTKRRVPTNPDAEVLNRLLTAAQDAMDQKDYETAAQNYQDYLAKKPDDAVVHYDLGYAYTALKRPSDAKTEYEKAISLDDKMAPAYLNLGLTLLESDPGAAVDPLQHAADLTPDQAEPKFLLGTALERSGKLAPAVEQYQAAEKLGDKDFDLHFSLGRILLSSHRAADAEPEFRAALALRPNAADAHLGLAQSLIAEKKLDAGATQLNAYLQSHPNDSRARIEHASMLVDLGKNDDALAELDRAAAGGPEDLRALKLRAQIYFAKKQFDKAVPVLQKAGGMAPQDVNIHALLGHALLETKDYSGAVRELTVANRLDPTASDVLTDLVGAEYSTGNYPTTLAILDALSKRGDLPAASWFIRGACYDKLGQLAPALDAYQKFLQLNKDQNSDMYFESSSRVRTLKRELGDRKK